MMLRNKGLPVLIAALFAFCAAPGTARANPQPGGTPWSASEIARLDASLRRLLHAPILRGAQIGFLIEDTVRKNVLFARNQREEFMPASNFKLLVGSVVLQRLGENFAFTTSVESDGVPRGGVLPGNLYLRGGGDAHLTAADLDAAAAALAARGITRVEGALVTDASHDDAQRFPGGWSWDDLPYYYAPVVSALELEEGTVHVFVSPGARVGAPVSVRVTPQSSAFTIVNDMTTGPRNSADTSDIVRPWDEPRTIELVGSYPLGAKESGDFAPAVPDPPSYAGDVFMRALAAHGIAVGGGVHAGRTPSGATVLWTHRSAALPVMMQQFWYPSDNLMGELFLKELGVVQAGEPGTYANGIIVERAYLHSIGIDPNTVSITDGSGLSQYDRITPADLVTILQADWNSPYRDVVIDALPLSGVRGTLKHSYIGTPAQGTVYAKTGNIDHVETMSGFVQTKTHGPITFSFLINQWLGDDHRRGTAELARVRSAIFSLLATQ